MDFESINELQELSLSMSSINQMLVEAKERHASIELDMFKALAKIQGSEKLSRDNRVIALIRSGDEEISKLFVDSENHVSSLNQAYRHAENMVNVKKHINNISNIK